MKILENNYEDPVFPQKVVCEHCKSLLEVERDDCEVFVNYNSGWRTYTYVCPCCKNENKIDSPL